MTSYATYDAGLPCKNPNCKSHGKPHPNCRCYPGMADGGEVAAFCSKDQKHDPSCEYFADGGTMEDPLHKDPHHSVASYLVDQGLHGLLKMSHSEDALEKYNGHVKKGHKHFDKHIEHLFKGGMIEDEDHSKSKKHIHEWIEKGGINQDLIDELHKQNAAQSFAEGGEANAKEPKAIHDHPVQHAYPEQNVMLQAAKGRMSNYLNSIKPQENAPRLAFDQKPDDKMQKKSYDKALHIAAHPLSILKDIQKGNIEPETIKHLKNLHPEVDNVLQKKLTERIVKDQLEHKKPSYKVRQGLSLLLGAPLGSEMTQPNLMAVQATFQMKKPDQQQDQAPVKNKKGTSSLSKASQPYLTKNDSLISRSQKQ